MASSHCPPQKNFEVFHQAFRRTFHEAGLIGVQCGAKSPHFGGQTGKRKERYGALPREISGWRRAKRVLICFMPPA